MKTMQYHHRATTTRRRLTRLALGLLCLTAAAAHAGPGFEFTTIDVPGSSLTFADGNMGRTIVGEFDDEGGTHGFILRKSGFTRFDVPGADGFTTINGINAKGDFAGIYSLNDRPYAYFARDGVVTTLDPPGSIFSAALFINRFHQVAGYWKDATGTRHGFIWRAGEFSPVDVPQAGPGGTRVIGINDRKDVVGTFYDGEDRQRGFVFSRGDYTTFDAPGSEQGYTVGQGINDRGEVVGFYGGADEVSHGFLLRDGQFTTIDVPGAIFTEVYSINAVGDVVGAFQDEGGYHGFLGRRIR